MSGHVDLERMIEAIRLDRFQATLLGLCFAITFLDGYDAQIVGFVVSSISADWHIDRSAFGPMFSAGFAGLFVGALVLGTAADRFGRKTILIVSVTLFGLFSLLTVLATGIGTLLAFRFIVGVGVGGAVPNAIALAGEYAPRSRRITVMTSVGAGASLGAAAAGLIAAKSIPLFGWKSVFYIGGVAPLMLALLLAWLLPESMRFLVVRKRPRPALVKVVRRLAPKLPIDDATMFTLPEAGKSGLPVKHLLTEGRGPLTATLWLAYIFNNIAMYTLIPWLPTLIHEMGLSIPDSAMATSAFSVGGIVGAFVIGRIIDKTNAYGALFGVLVVAACSTFVIGIVDRRFLVLLLPVFVAGFGIAGGQHGANAHAGNFYPTFIRSTGVGWAIGIGKIGSVLGPVMLGKLLGLHWPIPDILATLAVVVALAAVSFATMGLLHRRFRSAPSAAFDPVGFDIAPTPTGPAN